MRHFPLFLRLDGARVLIVGGAEQAAQKARLLSRTSARLELIATELNDELAGMVAAGRAEHRAAVLDPDGFRGARLVVVATGCPALDAAAADLARRAGALVNVVDRPALSDVTMPAIVERDPVVVAIGTEGTAPVLARQIRTLVETALEPGLGRFATLAGSLRGQVAARVAPEARRRFWEWACDAPQRLFAEGREADALAAIEAALAAGGAPEPGAGRVTVIDAGGEPDLMTLRAVRRLQSADLILYDPGCPASTIELARRDAARIATDSDGPLPWRGPRVARRAAAAAVEGREVVWLGEPGAAAAALARAGVAFGIVSSAPAPSAALAFAEQG